MIAFALSAPRSRPIRYLLAGIALSVLTGCGLAVVGGTAATTTLVATDRRTAGEQVDDKTIELRVSSEMNKAFGEGASGEAAETDDDSDSAAHPPVRILGTSYRGRVLLVGDVPTQADRERALDIARKIPKVTKVDDFIRVGDITPLSVRTNDTWLTSKVKSKLIATEGVPFRTMKVTTERGVVYLMGIVTTVEAERAALVASRVDGINKVVKLFRIVSPESLLDTSEAPAAEEPSSDSSDTSHTSDPDEGGAQSMPVK